MRKLYFVLIALVLFTSILKAQDERPKKYQSLLWEISGNGLKKPSYLYGTMHVSSKLAFHLSDSLFEAIKSVDMITLEVDFGVWMKEVINTMNARDNMEYLEYYNQRAGIYKNAFRPNIPEKEYLEQSLNSYPRIINHMLYRNNTEGSDFQEDTYLDLYIYQVGKKLNKKIGGLEDYIKSQQMANLANKPDPKNKKSEEDAELKEMRMEEIAKDKDVSTMYEDLYRSGDLDMMDSVQKLTSTKNFINHLLLDRNAIMAHSMDSLMKSVSLFTAIGCAHLPGDSGVIELLRLKGYTVKPLKYMTANGIDAKIKTQLEEIRYPVEFKTQTSSDSVFSVSLPGNLFEYINDVDGSKMYITNDLVNGGYYYIQRLNHFGNITSQDPSYQKKRIDSLLYENIPGEIKKKIEIKSNNGFVGYDITNKTNKGDWQRYNIFISPDEIFIFKFGGTGEYLNKGKEVDQFFNSIKFNQKYKNSFTTHTSKSGGYSIEVPSNHLHYKSKDPSESQRELITATNNATNDYYYFNLSSIYDYNYIEEDTFELNFLTDMYAKDINYKIQSKKLTSFEKYPAIFVKLKNDKDSMDMKIIIRGNLYYLLACKSGNNNTKSTFFNSLKFNEIEYTTPFQNYIDTTLHFSVKTQFEDSPYNKLVKQENEVNNSYNSRYEEEKPSDFLPSNNTRYYVSTETGEIIFVKFTKYSMYYQEKNKDEYWANKIKEISKTNGLIISKKSKKDGEKQSELNLTLTDTNSSRGILVKFIQKCGVLYTLKSPFDTIAGPTKFVKTFFETFKPQDTCIGMDILEEKVTEHFFNKLYSKDSATRVKVRAASEYVVWNLNDKHVGTLIKAIQDTGFTKLNIELKRDLFFAISKLKSDDILPFLEMMYDKYSDSLTIQRMILRAVSNQKNEKSTEYFIRLLRKELPVSSNNSDISNLFSNYHDTLEIATKLFPKILIFTKYPEYRTPIYQLMSACISKGLLKHSAYRKYKNEILLDAQYDLRLLMSSNEKNSRYRYRSNYSYERDYKTSLEITERSLDVNEQSIYNYSVILAPYYKDKAVKNYINKVFNNKFDKLNILIAGYYLKKGTIINDTIWNSYASNINTRFILYNVLVNVKHLEKFDKKYLTQKDLLLSVLYGNDDTKKDSLVYIDKKYVISKKDSGYVYIFKSCPKDKKIWKLAFTGIHPIDDKKIATDVDVNKSNVAFENAKQMDKEIETVLKKIRILKHKRATNADINDSKGGRNYYNNNYENGDE